MTWSVLELVLPEKKSLNGFWSRRSMFRIFWLFGMSLVGITEFEAEALVEAMDRNRWAGQALELPPKSWPQITWRADQRSASFQNLPLGSGMVAGFGVWGDFWENARFCGWACSAKNPLKIRTQNPHTQLKNAPKSAPKICAKIRTQNPHQNPHAKSTPKLAPKLSTNTHRDPQQKGHKGCPLSYTLLLLAQVSENQEKLHRKSVTRLKGKPNGN